MTMLDPQLDASNPRQSAFVTANAGSGKTTTLVRRVARLLLAGARPAAILCLTYTKAAAAEMQSRLFEELGGWAVMDDDRLRKELAEIDETGREPGQARRLFARALETPGGLKIQTIHAFCETLLKRFPLEAGVSPGFQVAEDAAAAEIAAEARDAVALATLRQPEGPLAAAYGWFALTLDQGAFDSMWATFEGRRAAIADYVTRIGGPENVSGDVWLRCTNSADAVDPDALAADAASPPALNEALWRKAVAALRSGGARDNKCAEKLQAVLDALARGAPCMQTALAALLTDGGAGVASTHVIGSRAVKTAGLDAALLDEADRLIAAREWVRAARIARDTVHALTLAAAYAEAYAQAKAVRSALDFSDLVQRVRALLAEREDALWVLYKLDGGVDHVLVDEAQDTAPEQWDIVRALTGEFFSGHGLRDPIVAPRTVFAVGDEKQSIFGFQGARPERLLQEGRGYQSRAVDAGGDLPFISLLSSYRSTPEVLTFVDAVFNTQPFARALSPQLGDGDRLLHLPTRQDHAGSVEVWDTFREPESEDPDLWDAPRGGSGGKSADKALSEHIARQICAMGDRGERVWDKRLKAWRALRPGDVLILVRRRNALFEEINRALKAAGLPVAGADRLKLSQHAAFGDLLALARFALFPDDDLTVAELLRSPLCDVPEEGDAGLYELAHARGGGLWGTLRARAAEHSAWTHAASLLAWARKTAREQAPFDFFAAALVWRGTDGLSLRKRLASRLGADTDDVLDAMLAEVLTAERQGPATLEHVVARLEAAEVEIKRELDEAAGEIRVMTVHGAKGLEAPVVILPDTTQKAKSFIPRLLETPDGGFLWCGAKGEDCEAAAEARAALETRDADESLRLFYVALTRARDRLIICGRQPGNVGDKPAQAGSWYDLACQALDHPSLIGVREVDAGGLKARRYGADPASAPLVAPVAAASATPPAWLTEPAPPEALSRFSAPSALAEVRRSPAPSPLAAVGRLGRFRRGSLIHRLLQLLPDVPPADRRTAAARLLARELGVLPDQAVEITASALSVLEDARFTEVFGPGSRAEAAVAGSAPELPAGLSISGRVDRLVVTPERVLVVDYKTNRPSPDVAENASRADLVQMATYVAVLRQVFPGRRVEAAQVWTDGAKLTPLSDSLVASTLAGLGRVEDAPADPYIAEPE